MRGLLKWMRPGLFIKRWLLLMLISLTIFSLAFAQLLLIIYRNEGRPDWFTSVTLGFMTPELRGTILIAIGILFFTMALRGLNRSLFGPVFSPYSLSQWADIVQSRQQLRQGLRVVALGGGTGLPSALRAMKTETSNITAVVTMSDDGGSSGRLRRDLGVQPPGDLRNNLTALARDEDLMTQLFNYRFETGELAGHSFGNLFLAALVSVKGSMDEAVLAAGRVLDIQGRVLPCTLTHVSLVAKTRHRETGELQQIKGESLIPRREALIEHVFLEPQWVRAMPEVMRALLAADLIIIGPGSLYTSILPNLLVNGVTEAIRASNALKVYVCNIATQPGETEHYSVTDHVIALEEHVGEHLFDVVIANNHFPIENAGPNTIYVRPALPNHPINQRYHLAYADLTDDERPWRHSPEKLRKVLLSLSNSSQRIAQAENEAKVVSLG